LLTNNEASLRTRMRPAKTGKPNSREELIAAAKALFAKNGYDGASVKEIADAAGVNVGLIAYYFGGKLGIFRECLLTDGEKRLAAARRILVAAESEMEFRLRLKLFAEEVLEFHLKDPDVTTMVHRECERGSPEVEDLFRNTYFLVFHTLQVFIESGKEKSLLRHDLDAEIATLFFFSQLIHAVRQDTANSKYFGKTLANAVYRERYISQIVGLFVGGAVNRAKEV